MRGQPITNLFFLYKTLKMKKAIADSIPQLDSADRDMYNVSGMVVSRRNTMVESRGTTPSKITDTTLV